MDAFESLISMLLRHDGYWTIPSYKVNLTAEEKLAVSRPTAPRWEIDLIAYKGLTNEVLIVECKSFLDSLGVHFRNGQFKSPERYKLFTDETLLKVVQERLRLQLMETGSCAPSPRIRLCMAVGKLANQTNVEDLTQHFTDRGWILFGPDWIRERLLAASSLGYENDVAFIVSKLLLRKASRKDVSPNG